MATVASAKSCISTSITDTLIITDTLLIKISHHNHIINDQLIHTTQIKNQMFLKAKHAFEQLREEIRNRNSEDINMLRISLDAQIEGTVLFCVYS